MTSVLERPADQVERTKLGIVDCDIHNYWDSVTELFPYLSKRWQDYFETFGQRQYLGGGYPRFWSDPVDKRPPSGRRPGADVGFMSTDHLDRNNIAYGILIPLNPAARMSSLPFASAFASAINDWQVEHWLNPEPRFRASLVVANDDVPRAVAEIHRTAADKRFVQVMFSGRPHQPMGRETYWPIYEACVEHGLAVMSHAFGSSGNPITGAGWASYYIEDHVGPPQAMQANITSMVMEGVFEQFPTLRVISVENGFGWVPPLVWRMDSAYKLLHSEVPYLKRLPSEYVAEHVYFATQPVEEPEKREYFGGIFEQFPALVDRLAFSSDYPHWDGDEPARALPLLRDRELRYKVLLHNGRRLYGLA